jgi:hypothetical protein
MKKLVLFAMVLVLIFAACSKPAVNSSLLESNSVSEKLTENRAAVLAMLEENGDPLEEIANPSDNEPVTYVYDEKTANGVPKAAYELIYTYYNTFVTLEAPDFSSFGGLPEVEQQLRLRTAKLRKQNIVINDFDVELKPLGEDNFSENGSFSGILECTVSTENENGAAGTEKYIAWLNIYEDGGESFVEAFRLLPVGNGGVYGFLDTEFAEVAGRYPEFKNDVAKIADAGICEIVLGQCF